MQSLSAIAFRSRATISLTDVEFEVLMLRIRTVNAMRRITGVLVRRGDELLEYIEGESCDVARTFERIKRSDFHVDMTVIHRGEIGERAFDGFYEAISGAHVRARLTHELDRWNEVLPAAREAKASNPALAAVVDCWDAWSTS